MWRVTNFADADAKVSESTSGGVRLLVWEDANRKKNTPRKTNMTMENQPFESMYLLLKI